MIKRVINWLKSIKANDPVYSCDVYMISGCAHVDGMYCDMKTCTILEKHKAFNTEVKTCQACNFRNRLEGCENRCTKHNKLVELDDCCEDWKV